MGVSTLTLVIFGGIGLVVFLLVIFSTLNKLFIKAEAGQALVKTGFGISEPKVALSSAFVLPLLHRIDKLDLTVKTVRIIRRESESLSCADGIRAEVEVDFYIKINAVQQDIQHVASTIGCGRASDIEILRELFEAKFADALKTAGAKLQFDQLYHNRRAFRDEILNALGEEGGQEIVLNGYKLDDVAIQYLEQLPLERHNEDNVLDARGRKEIAERTSSEAEAANKRLRQKEVTIAEQNREARVRQLAIEQDIKEKEALQSREIQEAEAIETSRTEKTQAEQEQISEEARILKERRVRVAEEQREQEIQEAEIVRERTVSLAKETKQEEIESAKVRRERAVALAEEEKSQEIEIARINREAAEAEAEKSKLAKLEETALQEAEFVRAEEQKETVRAVERANRTRKIEVIEAEQEASVQREERQVEADVEAYRIRTVSEANLEGAKLDAEAAEKKALAIETVGKAEAAVRRAELEAENLISERVILANAVSELIPQLPELVEKLMIPAEQIDSIRVLNVNGTNGALPGQPGGDGTASGPNSMAGDVVSTVLNVGMLMPVIREIMQGLQGNADAERFFDRLRDVPGGQSLLESLNANGSDDPPDATSDAAPDVRPSSSSGESAQTSSGDAAGTSSANDAPTSGPGAHSSEPPSRPDDAS